MTTFRVRNFGPFIVLSSTSPERVELNFLLATYPLNSVLTIVVELQ